jgi:tricorn protease
LPHATSDGKDAQPDAALQHLDRLIREQPRPVPAPPDYPDKSFHVSTK